MNIHYNITLHHTVLQHFSGSLKYTAKTILKKTNTIAAITSNNNTKYSYLFIQTAEIQLTCVGVNTIWTVGALFPNHSAQKGLIVVGL